MASSMNQRDRLFVQRELIAWADWIRQGQTFPNALGFKSGTVEYALMRGETGGETIGHSKVPERFSEDRRVEIVNKAFWNLDENKRAVVSGVYLHRIQEQRIANMTGMTRHRIRVWLTDSYICVFNSISTENEPAIFVNA